jgi:hypothetical protein
MLAREYGQHPDWVLDHFTMSELKEYLAIRTLEAWEMKEQLNGGE